MEKISSNSKIDAATMVRILQEKAELADSKIAAQTYRRFARMIERTLKPKGGRDGR